MKRFFLKTLHYIYIRLLAIVKPVSLGVRIMLVRDDQVLLVKHTYQDEWYFPGGGVKRGESLTEAAIREAREEVGATLYSKLEFVGVYKNPLPMRTDHIAFFLCQDFTFRETSDWEIEELALFPLDNLPTNVASGCMHRIEDHKNGIQQKKQAGDW